MNIKRFLLFNIFSDYKNKEDLHIGITDSEGKVYEYDRDGLHLTKAATWNQCLAVPILNNPVDRDDPVWLEYWDFTLYTIAKQERWVQER